jgi:hypothetical protein
MTRKDFELIAETIRNLEFKYCLPQIEDACRVHVAERFSEALKQTNPRFKPDTFVEACLKEK